MARLPSVDLSEHVAKREFTGDRQADVLKGSPHFRASSWELLPVLAGQQLPVTWFSVAWCHGSQSQQQQICGHRHSNISVCLAGRWVSYPWEGKGEVLASQLCLPGNI